MDELVDRATALDRLARGELDVAVIFEDDTAPARAADGVEVHWLFDDPCASSCPAGIPSPTGPRSAWLPG